VNFRISPAADLDIEQACDRVAEHNHAAADRLDDQLHRAIRFLARFPGIGHQRAEVEDETVRFWAVGNFVVAYRVEGDHVTVIRVLHGARDIRQIFTEE